MNTFSLEPLEKAVASLEESLAQPYNTFIRDSVVQRFEYTFELAFKTLKRFLEKSSQSIESIDTLSYKDICRVAAERGLIEDPTTWFGFREARNLTSHAYDEKKADQVYKVSKSFTEAIKKLLEKLRSQV